jgi:hypothetical protein
MRTFGLLAVVVAALPGLVACGGDKSDLEDLPRPLFSWEHRMGPCSQIRAVDGGGEVWGNERCETPDLGFSRIRALTKAERMIVGGKLVELRGGNLGHSGSCTTPSWHRFVDEPTAGQVRKWHVCGGDSPPEDGLSDLPEPFVTIAKAVSQ